MDPQTLLINLQKYIVHAKKDAQDNPWHINDLLPAVVAYIFPFYQELLKSKDKGYFQELVLALKPFVSRNKKRLSEYSFDALCNAVKDKWIPELENPFLLLKSISSFFESIDENGYIVLRAITFNGLMGRPFDDLPRQYGTFDYAAQEVTCSTTAKVLRERVPRNNNQIDSEAMDDAQTELIELFKKLGETRKNNPNCYRYDIFCKRELTDWKLPQYAWQWNFSIDEYNGIKQLLKKHALVLKDVIKQNKICCKLLKLYVSEWYKRDYNGNDGQGNAFDAINLNINNSANLLCITLGISGEKVYWSDFDENGNDIGQREWLGTLYVDGGLPLKYFDNNDSSNLRKAIENVIAKKDDEYKEKVQLFGESYGSRGPIYQSYGARLLHPNDNDASIYDFIQEWIVNERLIIPEYDQLRKELKDGGEKRRKELLAEKFEVRYIVYKAASHIQLIPQLYLNQNAETSKYAISPERLNEWNVQPQNNRFVVQIKDENGGVVWKKQFDKCLAGYYITFPKKDRFDLKIDKRLCLGKWDVRIDGQRITDMAISNDLQENGYVKMYSKDGFSWYSQWSSDYKNFAVLFDNNRVKEEFEIVDENFGWVQIEDSLKLTIDDKEIIFYNKAGDLYVEPECKPLNRYFNGRDVEGEQMSLIYCDEKTAFRVFYSKDGTDINKKDISKEVSYRFRYGSSGDFLQLGSIDHCGYLEINVTYEKINKEKTIRCFAISKDAQIYPYNDGKSVRIDFRNFGGLTVYFKNGESLEKLTSDYKKYWVFSDNDYHHPEAAYQITDGNVKFELSCYKPINATIVKKKSNGSIFDVGSNNAHLRMPLLVLDKIIVQQLKANNSEDDNDTTEQDRIIEIDKIRFRSYAFNALIDHNYRDNNLLPDTYLDFQTFTHTKDNLNDIDLSGLSFVFVPTSHPLNYQTVSLNKGLPRFGIASQEEGIVVQCIDEYEIPKILLKPIYIPENENNLNLDEIQRRNRRNERINRYHDKYSQSKPDYSDALAYFEIAAKTGMYFGVFDALLGMIRHLDCPSYSTKMKRSDKVAKHLAQFYKCYRDKCDKQFDRPNYGALWRMADEFMFDWCLIPREVWLELFDSNNEKVVELLGNRPCRCIDYSDFIKDDYWVFNNIKTKNIDKEKETKKWLIKKAEKLNVEYDNANDTRNSLISKIKKDYKGDRADFDIEFQVFLEKLSAKHSENESFNIVLRTISGIYGNDRNSEKHASFWKQDLNKRIQVLKALANMTSETIGMYSQIEQ